MSRYEIEPFFKFHCGKWLLRLMNIMSMEYPKGFKNYNVPNGGTFSNKYAHKLCGLQICNNTNQVLKKF
jgi:hypothetical protein